LLLGGILLAGCSKPRVPPASEAPANVAATPNQALPLLSPERYDSMARWEFPLADTVQACVPLDSVPAPADPDRLTRFLRDGERFRCTLAPDLSVTIELHVDTIDPGHTPINGATVLPESGDPYPLNDAGGEPPPRGFPFLATQDFDFDRLREVKLLVWWGGTGNTGWSVYRWDRSSQRLVQDTMLSRIGDPDPLRGTNCLRTGGTGGAAGAIHGLSIDCWFGGRLVQVYAARQDQLADDLFLREGWALLPGRDTLVLVRVDTIRGG
jgi:hypothetical protein